MSCCLMAAAFMITTVGAAGSAGSAQAAPSASGAVAAGAPKRFQIVLDQTQYAQLQGEFAKQQKDLAAGKRLAPPVQSSARSSSAPATQGPLDARTAEAQARAIAATPQALDTPATVAKTAETAKAAAAAVAAAAPPIGTTPATEPAQQCLSSGAADAFGRILNRFAYCHTETLIAEYILRIPRLPDLKLGEIQFTYETFAQGDERTRSVRIFSRVVRGSVDYRWRDPVSDLVLARAIPLTVGIECVEGASTCAVRRANVTLPFATWNGNTQWFYWDVATPRSAGTGRDAVSYARWYQEFETRYGRASADLQTDPRQIRCDSATYFVRGTVSYPAACIFNEVTPHLDYSVTDPSVGEVARHIEQAQDDPNATRPLLVPPGVPAPRDKLIPGKYLPANVNPPGLHRIREATDPEYLANGQHKDAACYGTGPFAAEYQGLGLPPADRPVPGVEDCDEYPFATTLEGAANPDWDFSVRAVALEANRSAGSKLGAYLTNDRILAWDPTVLITVNDRFYVQITD